MQSTNTAQYRNDRRTYIK